MVICIGDLVCLVILDILSPVEKILSNRVSTFLIRSARSCGLIFAFWPLITPADEEQVDDVVDEDDDVDDVDEEDASTTIASCS